MALVRRTRCGGGVEARWEAGVLREWGEVGGAGWTSMKEEVPDCATVPSWLIRSSLDMPAHTGAGGGVR